MFDHIAPNVFWPLFVLAWIVSGIVVALLFGRVVDMSNPRNRYENGDDVAERHRRLARNGFKSKQGIR